MQRLESLSRGLVRRETIWAGVGVSVCAYAVLIYLVINFALVSLLPGELNLYLVQPLLWSYLALLACIFWKYGLKVRPRLTTSIVSAAVLIGVFQIALFAAAGLLFGFGASPYTRQPLPMLGNVLYLLTQLAGVETARSCMVGLLGKRSATLALVSATLFFSLLSVPVAAVTSITDTAAFFKFMGEVLLPTVSKNALSSFLALVGGPLAALAYRGTLEGFEWLSPVLPDLQWLVTAFLGTMIPAMGLLVIRNEVLPAGSGEAPAEEAEAARPSSAWMLVAAVIVTLLFFNTGLLGIRPTVVFGVSMAPTFRAGDVAITRDIPAGEVKVGDVVRYRTGDSFVLHRVMEIQQGASGVRFITRGDANNVEDQPVSADQIEGKVIFVVPKIGLVALGFHTLISWVR